MIIENIIIAVCLIIMVVLFGISEWENKRMKSILAEDDNIEAPLRYIMIKQDINQNTSIDKLAAICIAAHEAIDINIRKTITQGEYSKIIYDNEDELIVYKYGAQITPLSAQELESHTMKIFFDSKLPEGAERAIIQQLGLVDIMVTIGICKDLEEEDN